ncbi:Protein S19 forms a complex with S13 that binds strongly to the 16S ribosomal RNA [Glugoides intestinalis]
MVDLKKRAFKQLNYKGKSLEELIEMPVSEFAKIIPSSQRRHLLRGINKYEDDLLKRIDEAQNSSDPNALSTPIKTHERSMIILPCMLGCTIAVHGGNGFFPIEIKPEMLGTRLRDYVPTRTVCTHGKPGIGSTSGSKFTPLK